MGPAALAEAVARLPWLSPGAAALLAVARSPTAASWDTVRVDPGAVLLVVRHSPVLHTLSGVSFLPALVANPCILEDALRRLEASEPGWVDGSKACVQPVYQAALRIAQTAHELAERGGVCDPDAAWVAGLLTPLGWLGVAAVDPAAIATCLADPEFGRHAAAVQERLWGMDAAALGRRLARRWQLPGWLSAVIAYLNLPVEIAVRFGADPEILRLVQQAVRTVEAGGQGLQLIAERGESSSEYSVASTPFCPGSVMDEDSKASDSSVLRTECSALSPSCPADVPLLKDLLRLAAENLRQRGTPLVEYLENHVDELHALLEEQRAAEIERLREQKLRALAEFAAGAGHEINNPLAVISGQAQYLLKKVGSGQPVVGSGDDAASLPTAGCALRTALEAIIAQTQRIHQILRDLMQFARPPQPVKQSIDLRMLVRETATALEDLARQREVRLDCIHPDAPVHADADPSQIRTALACLLRNAIEAAPSGPDVAGWASIRLTAPDAEHVEVIIEDNGPGPAALEREHLFDPFFSGRPAGRGRGLGLPTAWRLARQHGGDVRFTRPADGPTRFVLTLPRAGGLRGQAAA